MKAKRKRNHLENEADKIEEIPEELKNSEDDVQEKPSAANKPKKKRFLARLRKAWTRIIGCMRCCTSIQDAESHEELPEASGISIANSKANSSKGKEKENDKGKSKIINITHEKNDYRSEEFSRNSSSLGEILEELDKSDNISQSGSSDDTSDSCSLEEEIPQEIFKFSEPSQSGSYDNISDSCSLEEEIPEELKKGSKTSQSGINDDTFDSCSLEEEIPEELKKGSKTSQSGINDDTFDSCSLEEEIPEELKKGSKTSQSGINDDTFDSCSLEEEIPEELKKGSKTSQSGINDDTFDSCSLEEEIPEELKKGSKTSQSGINDDTSDSCSLGEVKQKLNQSTKPTQSVSNDNISDSCPLGEVTPQELFKSNKTSQSSRRDDASDSCTPEEEIPKELNNSMKTSQSDRRDDTFDSCSLGEVKPQELNKSTKPSQSGSNDDTSDSWSLEEEILKELFKSNKTSQSSRRDDASDSWSLEEEILKELFKSSQASQSGRRGDTSDSCPLGEVTPQELFKSSTTSESCTNRDEEPTTSDVCLEKPNQAAKKTTGTVPLTLNSFKFHQKLGAGYYGNVYLARDVIRKQCVAIKVSPKPYVMIEYRFAERHVLQLSHESPYLIHGLAAFHTQNQVYYVMELANGGDLHDFIYRTFPLDTATIKFIIAEIICGIQFLHKNGIIHRDLKPANILLTAHGHIKISDFGFAIIDVYEKTNELRRGTPGYVAPEQLKGVDYGPGVDYFAIGVILYKLYHFKIPFNGEDGRDIDLAVLFQTPRYRKSLTKDTVKILKGLLEKDQFKRLGVNGDIKNHQYFNDMNWEDVEARRVAPPAIMTATCIDLNLNDTLPYAEQPNNITAEDQNIFNKFSFVCAEWSRHYHPVIVKAKY